MIPRRWLLALALAAGAVAGGTYLAADRRADVVVAGRDIAVPRPLTREDLELRSVAAALVPEDAVRSLDVAVGSVPRAPLMRGQLVLGRAIAPDVSELRSGLPLPRGQRAVAIPVRAVDAVGGAILPGSRVDVLSVPVLGRAPAGRTTELLIAGAAVLDVRGEAGGALVQSDAKTQAVTGDRIASVVIAIPMEDEIRFADRIATSTFVLALTATK
ncbi:MAG TPA: Flp pilus assembly protein CpaB [Candidatus Limnocylindria bacterium]